MKKIIIVIVVIIVLIGGYFLLKSFSGSDANKNGQVVTPTPTDNNQPVAPVMKKDQTVIGTSVEGRDIVAYHFGAGVGADASTADAMTSASTTAPNKELLFVGGIHGGYEWNTVLVAYELMDYLKANPSIIPENLKVTVIPALNPDGLYKVVGTEGRFEAKDVSPIEETVVAGRFNANDVDLNRNFDCDWQAEGKWQNKTVSGGDKAFSEPESLAMRNYINDNTPAAVVVWYSAANGVFASNCHNGILPETKTLTNTFAKASGYKAYENFNFYEITGDMVNWLAKNKIPAISVLLANHTDTDWTKNKAGVDALLKLYAK